MNKELRKEIERLAHKLERQNRIMICDFLTEELGVKTCEYDEETEHDDLKLVFHILMNEEQTKEPQQLIIKMKNLFRNKGVEIIVHNEKLLHENMLLIIDKKYNMHNLIHPKNKSKPIVI